MPMCNLIEYSDNYSKTSGGLWQYRKDIPAVDDNNAMIITIIITLIGLMLLIHLILKQK